MNLLYTSPCCSIATANKLLEETKTDPGYQIIKFSNLFLQGLTANGVLVDVIANVRVFPHIFWRSNSECENGILFHYPIQTRIPLLRQVLLFCGAFFKTFLWGLKQREEKLVLCDVLSIVTSAGCRTAAKILGIPVCALVTDMLGCSVTAPQSKNNFWIQSIISLRGPIQKRSISKYDGYVFLTKYMNIEYNPYQKPYIIMEGCADASFENQDVSKDFPRIIMYAGAIEKQYGFDTLVQAFMQLELPNIEFHLYGKGKFIEQLLLYAQKDARIKYMGVVSNTEVVVAEQRATLLVNPRFSNQDFVKYSFPSKTTEYMVSGTPLLTTRLAGIPDEYFQYCYTFESETVDGFARKLTEVLSLSDAELQAKGKSAQEFVLKYKNNIIQGERLKSFFQTILSAHR